MLVELVKSHEIRVPYGAGRRTKPKEPKIPATAERNARVMAHVRRIQAEIEQRRKLGGWWSV